MTDPEMVKAVAAQWFPQSLFAGEDLDEWHRQLMERIALLEAVLEFGRAKRDLLVAAQHDVLGRTYAEIAAAQGGLSATRAAQLAARGRPHLKPLPSNGSGSGR